MSLPNVINKSQVKIADRPLAPSIPRIEARSAEVGGEANQACRRSSTSRRHDHYKRRSAKVNQ